MNFFEIWFSNNLDLISVALAVAATAMLGFVAYFSNRKSVTSRTFLLFALLSSAWGLCNYVSYQVSDPAISIWLWRCVLLSAVWFTYGIFQLAYVFPNDTLRFPWWYKWALLPAVAVSSVMTLSPFEFKGFIGSLTPRSVPSIELGMLMPLFGATVSTLILAALVLMIRKALRSRKEEALHFRLLLIGTLITFSLLIAFNYVLPTQFNERSFIPLGALFIFPFIAFAAYAILRHHLFKVKAIAVSILLFFLSAVSIMQVVFADTYTKLLLNLIEFAMILVFGVFLLRAVVREVNQREEIEGLAKKLEKANERLKALDKMKSEFVSIASHQLRSPLTSIRGYSSMLLEGSFGKLPKNARMAVERIDESSRFMATSVEDYLNVSRIQAGNMKYEYSDFNIRDLAERVADDTRQLAVKKGLLLMFKSDMDKKGIVHADVGKTRQVIDNLINNALKYTPKGSITIFVHDNVRKKQVYVDVIDTGIGMSEFTRDNMFEKFERASNANEVNVTGTGLGLYIARKMAREMGGDVIAYSDGEGEGSTFRIEMPLLM